MLRLRVFGVGDGDCIVLELPDGRFALVDSCFQAGQNTSPALPLLRDKELAFACLTHPHHDHFAGMCGVLSAAITANAQFWYALHDVETVLRALSSIPTAPGYATSSRAVDEAKELYDLLDWVEAKPPNFPRKILGVQNIPFEGGVEIIAFGPRDVDWVRYRRAVDRQLQTGCPISRQRANSISITLLLRYAGHLIWLLADLTKIPLQYLPARARASGIASIGAGVLATILKVPHHGASNGWFNNMHKTLMRCEADDVVVISAAGGIQHPNPAVLSSWRDSRKRIVSTYSLNSAPNYPLVGGAVGTIADQIARPLGIRTSRDVVVEISAGGVVTVN